MALDKSTLNCLNINAYNLAFESFHHLYYYD